MHDVNYRLYDAVVKGQTGNALKFLRLGADVNKRDVIDGMTPLLKAARRRNFVMMKLLLFHGAKPNTRDRDRGLTAMHYSAEAGDTESMMLLLAFNANMDSTDYVGCTPLHYASNRNHTRAADLLVFCGSDATVQNTRKETPISICENEDLEEILQESKRVVNGMINNDVFIEHRQLETDSRTPFDKIGLVVFTPPTFSTDSLSFLCRRVRPEYSDNILRPDRQELLISDTFQYRLSSSQSDGIVWLEIPLYNHPDPFEDVYMKTDTHPKINPDNKILDIKRIRCEKGQSDYKWVCYTEVDITAMSAFCLVTVPRVETFNIPPEGTTVTSDVDQFVQISVPPNTFDSPKSVISLEVMPSPVFDPQDFDKIVSVSHFYDLNHNHCERPQKEVGLKVPLPQDYDGEGSLYILGAELSSQVYLDMEDGEETRKDILERWSIIEKNPVTVKGCIKCPVTHFSYYVASEAQQNMSEEAVIAHTSTLCKRASLRKQHVKLIVMLKPLGSEMYDVVVEIVIARKAEDRLNQWRGCRYLDQKPSVSRDFESVPRKRYCITLSDEIEKHGGFPTTPLDFHPKRFNYQLFQICRKKNVELNFGSVILTDEETGEEIARLTVHLTGSPFLEDLGEFEDGFPGFTRNSLLKHIARELGDEWIKVSVLLGLTYRTVEEHSKLPNKTITEKKFKILQLWRDFSKNRHDLGVPDLLSALGKTKRDDVVEYVNTQLKAWLQEKKDQPDRFYTWLEEALQGPSTDILETNSHPEPMTDQFYVLLVEKCGINLRSTGSHLNLSKPELDGLFSDTLISKDEHKLLHSLGQFYDLCSAEIEEIVAYPIGHGHRLLRMLVVAREKSESNIEAFKMLIEACNTVGLTEAKQWILDMSKEWLMGDPEATDPFRIAVQEVIESVEGHYMQHSDHNNTDESTADLNDH
ncbi:uncharacterized protein LOC117325740 isoform X1 [Pecten maximus]|uniref:uncharacterized protein LOC117325740 isoform X1 n=1 Tax=Pecten maximus TaxID=6579 RepID=UPI0014582130|nr:uncharacterized protein LOC117325740 isoform X1 [Pecten maximus]